MGQPVDYRSLADDLGIKGRMAGNELYGCCPLHHDRRPSFSLNVINGLWICFSGCGQGDFPRLVQEILGVTAHEAEIWIIEHEKFVDAPKLAEQLSEATALPQKPEELLEPWRVIYEKLTTKVLPTWYFRRGFTWGTADEWGIRWDAELEQLVIPVHNPKGELVGTIGRNLKAQPKYVNSPGLPASKILFGLGPEDRNQAIILVEGPLDALWLRQLGYRGLALLSTSLSTEQILLLEKWHIPKIYLAMDNDPAGRSAQEIHIRNLRADGWMCKGQLLVLEYPEHVYTNSPGLEARSKKDVQDCSEEEVMWMIQRAKEV